jgi:hypothetical protein
LSTRERPRDEKPKKEATETIDDWLDSYSSQKETEPKQVAEVKEEEPVVEVVEDLMAEFSRKLPSWIGKPWMYVKPTHEGHFKNWIDSWKKLILDYSELLTRHIVSVYDLRDLHPFTNKENGKDLSIGELQTIISKMVDDNLAKWLDTDNLNARIYFKTDLEWASILYQFMVDNGYATDILTLYEMKNLGQKWSSLPDTELALILDILVEQNKAKWIGADRDTVQFKI